MVNFEEAAAQLNIKTIFISLILSAFGFLVALQWRDIIKETIDLLIPSGEGLIYKYITAIIITMIAVIVAYILVKIEKTNIIPDKYTDKVKKKLKKNKGAA